MKLYIKRFSQNQRVKDLFLLAVLLGMILFTVWSFARAMYVI